MPITIYSRWDTTKVVYTNDKLDTLSGANLRGANLYGANLSGVKGLDKQPPQTKILPDEGDIIGFK